MTTRRTRRSLAALGARGMGCSNMPGSLSPARNPIALASSRISTSQGRAATIRQGRFAPKYAEARRSASAQECERRTTKKVFARLEGKSHRRRAPSGTSSRRAPEIERVYCQRASAQFWWHRRRRSVGFGPMPRYEGCATSRSVFRAEVEPGLVREPRRRGWPPPSLRQPWETRPSGCPLPTDGWLDAVADLWSGQLGTVTNEIGFPVGRRNPLRNLSPLWGRRPA